METTELRKLLEQIHAELQQVQRLDAGEQQLLRELSDDINGLLTQPAQAGLRPADGTLARIEQFIGQAEVEHPVLTSTLGQLMAVLSNAGI